MRMVIFVSRAFCSTDQEKRETARSLNPFCQQVDDWMLLKIINRKNDPKNALNKRKNPG